MPAVPRNTVGLRRLFGVLGATALVLALLATAASAADDPSSFSATPSPAVVNQPVKFTITYNGPQGGCYDYEWEFGDPASNENSSTETNPTHTFKRADTYEVTVIAYYDYEECSTNIPCSECSDVASLDSAAESAVVPAYFPTAVGCDGYCYTTTEKIEVKEPAPATSAPPTTPNKQPSDNDDSDDSDDGDNDDSRDDDDDDSAPGAFVPRNQPPLTDEPSPEPTEPSPEPTAPTNPITPTDPTSPTDPTDPKSAAWITGAGASSAAIALFILGAVIGSLGGLSLAGRKAALVADRDENTIQRHVAARDAEGWGDRSFTWRFPGHKLIDAASVVIPDRFHRFSPLLGRVTEDGSEFRAMFGSLWLATPLAGIALGIASAAAAGGRAMPPSLWLLVGGAILATFDAFSGALAIVVFAGAALVGGLGGVEGGPDTVHSLLVVLAIGFLWMAIPLIGSAIRPFRRLGDGSLRHRWDVSADGLIAALLCGWVAQKITKAMDLFAGQATGLPDHANTVAIVVMVAVALRVAMEHFSMSAYPQRLQAVEGADPPPPFLLSTIMGAFIRTAVFGFIGYAFIGSCWQLWLGVGLFLIPQLIDHIREAFPNVGMVRRILPRGVVEIFILVVACTLAARFAMSESPDEFSGLRLAFLLIAVPPALLGALRVLAEDADESGDTSWARQFLGAIIVAVTAVLAARGWDY